jgi:RES domain-containing protein
MAVFYRIVGSHRAASAMDGEGARKMGGRWNPPGIPVAYLTESRALAALEILVHTGRAAVNLRWAVIAAEVPAKMIEAVLPENLPVGWDDVVSPSAARKFGADWVRRGDRAGILLPSVIVPEERVLMLNVRHPDFRKLVFSAPKPFLFDQRLG